jgi:VWFA-related protein
MAVHHRLVIAPLAAALLTAAAAAQAPPPATQKPGAPQITFRTGSDYIEIDAVVTDAKGQFVRDLTLGDFEVLENKKPQKIDVFTLVDIPLERADRPAYRPTAVDPDIVTNERDFEGRIYMLVLDANHVRPENTALVKKVATQFIQRNMGANDIAAVVLAQTGSRDDNREFTSLKSTLIASINKFAGEKVQSKALAVASRATALEGTPLGGIDELKDPLAPERAAKARATLDTMQRVSNYMAGIRGRRKALILISEGLDFNTDDIIGPRSSGGFGQASSGIPSNPMSGNSVNESIHAASIIADMQVMFEAASRANVAVYSVDPRGVASETELLMQYGGPSASAAAGPGQLGDPGLVSNGVREELRRQMGSLRTYSEVTGGLALVGTNDFETGFRKIVQDNSAYYVLGYNLQNPKNDGKFHEITVRVKRPGLQVRARKGYYAANAAASAKAAPAPDPTVTLLNSPMPVAGLGLRLSTASLRDKASDKVIIPITVEFNGSDLVLDGTNKVNVMYVAVDMSGKVHASGQKTMDLAIRPESRKAVASNGLRLVTEVMLPPGHYQLRLAAHDPVANRSGSVFWDLEVPDFDKQTVSMGNLLLSAASAGRTPTSLDAPSVRDVLPGPPTSRREFTLEDTIAVYAEIYDNETTRQHTVDLTTTIRTDDGTQVFVTREERASPPAEGKRHVYSYLARIPLQDLVPGKFVLTVEGRSRLGDKASREIQFTIK